MHWLTHELIEMNQFKRREYNVVHFYAGRPMSPTWLRQFSTSRRSWQSGCET
jgi:hypothetical protein